MSFTSWLRNPSSTNAGKRSGSSRRKATGARRGVPCLQVERLEDRWCPSYTLVTSRAALAGTDSVNWGILAPTPPPSNTVVANPFSILSTSGRSLRVSAATVNSFDVTQQVSAPPFHGNGEWNGNFAVGDWVLATDGGNGKTNPITLNFGATTVAAGGAQIQPNSGGLSFTFIAQVGAFDAAGKSLASYTEKGTVTDAADNSAIFIGISSSSANISRIALSISKVSGGTGADKPWFAINQFDFRTSAAAAAPAISQPASAINLTPLMSSLLSTGQPVMPAASHSSPLLPSTSPASQSGALLTSGTTSAVPVEATDAVFAASHPAASDDNAGLFVPLSLSSWDAV
jgi:hypothetical protein